MLRALGVLILIAVVLAGGAYVAAGRTAPPHLTITKPERFVGQASTLEVTAEAPKAKLASLDVTVEQNGKSIPLFSMNGGQTATLTQSGENTVVVRRPLGKRSVPELQQGAARVVVTATRKSFLNLRTVSATATKDFQVRLEPPRITILSTHHYINHGGSEFVVYRSTPPDVASGVRVGDVEYPGFAAAGAGVTGGDPALKVAFFALLYDQDLNTPIQAFARDEAGNEVTAKFIDNVFQKPQKKSNIPLDDKFLQRVVPEILEHSPEFKIDPPQNGDYLTPFLKINSELRQLNAKEIAAMAAKSAPTRMWQGPFVQLGNSKVEAAFADHRTYFYQNKEVDRQVHLGFDLAVTAHAPVVAAADGNVLSANWLGIYGNCIVIDHGLGIQSLYGHLQSFEVKVGDHVTRGQEIGRTDTTGLAGGDHLHFTMLVNGRMVNPVEWWDPHWIADRVDRKLREAGAPVTTAATQ
jgi:murein DD-endopeptidase MepM/ murein hydrolase activator NlpD